MNLQELVLCSTAPTSASSGAGSIAVHDILTGSSLASFKQTSAPSHCTAVVPTRDGQGGYVLAAQGEKGIMNLYHFQKDQLSLKIVLPEKLSCIAVDPNGTYCAGGTAQGRIYLWEISSGIMYNAWDAHYRQVNVLRFTQDGVALLSGSEDSGVNVWSVQTLVDETKQNELPAPYSTLSDHTLPIHDIAVGVGLFPTCRVLTSSLDHTVKLWDLSSPHPLLTTFQFPQSVGLLAWDPTERVFFVASSPNTTNSSKAEIYQMNMFRQQENQLGRVVEAMGGAGSTDVIRFDSSSPSHTRKRLIAVDDPVSSITLTPTSSQLLVGTQTGSIHIYDTSSHQLLRSIFSHKGFSITHLQCIIKPSDLVGHVSLNLNPSTENKGTGEGIPPRVVAPFQRVRDPKSREAHEISIMLRPSSETQTEAFFSYPNDELLRDHAFFLPSPSTASSQQTPHAVTSAKVQELEEEVRKLREQLTKAKGLNDAMWEAVVQRTVLDGRGSDAESRNDNDTMVTGEEGRKQKRPRV